MNKNRSESLAVTVDRLASALIQTGQEGPEQGAVRVVAMRPNETQEEARKRAASFPGRQLDQKGT